ncbi:transposase [Bifidobacterium breve]|uniref:IS3 family transposase n=1 Tax=Bifidobacterium breve TaxID=1685 RepID=UPI0009EF9C1B|nr:IS3 family transposase [Bifidobacterium breve]OQM61630.1 transposase [Bifidobacterium breve]
MARYGREQRGRAVDLYVRYERCAADVIRELGHPGKGALLSWYADRLEEERTRGGDAQEEAPDGRREESRRGDYGVGKHADVRIRASGHGGSGGHAGSMEARLARLQARLDELDADVERQRREKKEPDIEIAIRKGTLELLGKEPGTDPENPAGHEKTLLVKQTSEKLGVTAGSLLPVVGVARGTYHYQPDAMKRPDKDSGLLELVREAFENSKRRYGYKRVHLELRGMGIVASAKQIMGLMTRHGLVPPCPGARSGTARTRAS